MNHRKNARTFWGRSGSPPSSKYQFEAMQQRLHTICPGVPWRQVVGDLFPAGQLWGKFGDSFTTGP